MQAGGVQFDATRLGEALLIASQAVVFFRWIYRRMRNDEIYRAFVRDMAINHLPHLYSGVRKIAIKVGIDLPDDPQVQFVDLNGNGKH